MRFCCLLTAILCGILAAGCATTSEKSAAAAKRGSPQLTGRLIEPDTALVGRVVTVNTNGQFAVLSFPLGRLPTLDQALSVYHNGQKIGELKTTRHELDDLVVADIVSGECQPGDEVSDR
jgi:hypothetical protein